MVSSDFEEIVKERVKTRYSQIVAPECAVQSDRQGV